MDRHRHSDGFIFVTAAATALLALVFGVRAILGMLLGPLNSATGLGFAAVSMALAVSQLVAGVSQPVCGGLADRYGATWVVFCGGVLLALGIAALAVASTLTALVLAFSLIAAASGAVGSTPVLLSAVGARVHADRRALATGVVSSGASLGQFALPPIMQAAMAAIGSIGAVLGLALLSLVSLPLARFLRSTTPRKPGAAPASSVDTKLDVPPRQALRELRFWMLAGGFMLCGFHVSFMLAHMPGVIEGCGYGAELTGVWFSVMGLANLTGTIGVGFAAQRLQPRTVLVLVYAARALGIALFVCAPRTPTVLLGFAVWMGATYMATMPPTAALVGKFYGTRNLGMLFGIVMLVHQVGSFLGVWLGGWAFERNASFDGVWLLDIGLACLAVVVYLAIPWAQPRRAARPDPRKIRPASAPADRSASAATEWHGRRLPRASSLRSAVPSAAAGSG